MERQNPTTTARLRQEETHPDDVRSLFEHSFTRRSYNPLEDPLATEALASQLAAWRSEGRTIVFTSGVYDLFHANHRTYLMHTKIAAAPYCWEQHKNGDSVPGWGELDAAERNAYTRQLLEQDKLRLVVSIDGNMAVAARKGFNPEKGNSERPVFDWQTRARDVLSTGFEVHPAQPRLIVDAVTIHDNAQPELAVTPHCDIMDIAEFIRPDVWSVYFESEDIIEAVSTTHTEVFADVDVAVLTGHDFYHDRLLGGPFKTTSIVKRIGGTMLNGNGSN